MRILKSTIILRKRSLKFKVWQRIRLPEGTTANILYQETRGFLQRLEFKLVNNNKKIRAQSTNGKPSVFLEIDQSNMFSLEGNRTELAQKFNIQNQEKFDAFCRKYGIQ